MSGRVLIIAAHFAPENVSGTHRSLHFARSLVDAGFTADVVTLPLNRLESQDARLSAVFPYPDSIHRVAPRATVSAAYLAGKRRWQGGGAGRTEAAGTSVPVAVSGSSSPRLSSVRRVLAEVEVFPDRYAAWRIPATRAAIAIGQQRCASIVFASGPPWTALRVGAAAAARLQLPFIADFRDPWTRRTGAHANPEFSLFRRLAARWEHGVVTGAELLLFNSAAVAHAALAGYPELRTSELRVILNGTDAPRRDVATPIPQDTPIRFRHFGTLYQGRSLDPLVYALRNESHGVDLELYGVSEWRAPGATPGVRVTARGTITHGDAIAAMREPAVLVLVQPPHFDRQIPTKLFEYLCTGNPVLVMASRDSAAWALATQYARCKLLEYGAAASHEKIIADLCDQWRSGKLCQAATAGDTSHFTKAAVGQEFIGMVEEVSRRGGAR